MSQATVQIQAYLALQHWDSHNKCLITKVFPDNKDGQATVTACAQPGDSIFKVSADAVTSTQKLMIEIAGCLRKGMKVLV